MAKQCELSSLPANHECAPGEPATLVPSLRKAAADVDRNQTINNVLTVEQYSAGQLRDRKHYGVTATDPLTFGLVLVAMAVVALLAMLHSGAQSAAH